MHNVKDFAPKQGLTAKRGRLGARIGYGNCCVARPRRAACPPPATRDEKGCQRKTGRTRSLIFPRAAFSGPWADIGLEPFGIASVECTFRRFQGGETGAVGLSLRHARRYVGMALLLGANLSQDASIDVVRPYSYKLLQRLTVSASDC